MIKKNWELYLVGFIEADGHIYVPKNCRSLKGQKLYPSIQISSHSKDFPLLTKILEKFQKGSIHKKIKKRAYVLNFTSKNDILELINILNGSMRTSKIQDLHKLIDWFNENHSTFFDKKPIDNSNFLTNPWLSGFIDGDGCFYLRCSEKTKYPQRFECKFEISQSIKQDYSFMFELSKCLVSNLKEVKKKDQLRVRTSSINQNLILIDYLKEYPLYSSKFLDFLDWEKGFNIILNKEHKTDKGKESIIKLKKGMNSSRKVFFWNHLQFF